ncbi:MAG: hypothetical protein OXH03_00580 [Bacteroidetes bacterium]|nr:hypothetical protein [Bacteroidota bacterium]MDE2671893.1 hypothetical protein [Bacteroidota bacterium]
MNINTDLYQTNIPPTHQVGELWRACAPSKLHGFCRAYDEVVPGFADRFCAAALYDRQWRSGSTRVRKMGDMGCNYIRTMNLYMIGSVSTHCHKGEEPHLAEEGSGYIEITTRGYVSVMRVYFPDVHKAHRAMYGFRAFDPREGYERGRKFWLYPDGTPQGARRRATRKVLDYITEHACSVVPVWQELSDEELIRSS